jgi:release factor glutamine methyltransferase
MTIHEAQQQLLFQLYHIYNNREAAAIADLVMENITDWKKIDRIINKQIPLSIPQNELLKKYTEELLMHKPVQYVLHEAWFCGMKLYVDENVLIPRPETEELIELVLEEAASKQLTADRILEIGSGSGCIPIALKKKLPGAEIYSCDVSKSALNIAKKNATDNDTDIHFLQLDFLSETERNKLPSFNIIISNPPYIPSLDKETIDANVVNFEPHLALFVDNNDPLIFYNAIADFAKEKLNPNGNVYVEIHENLAFNVKKLFSFKGFQHIEIKKDMQGKDRMIKATMLL